MLLRKPKSKEIATDQFQLFCKSREYLQETNVWDGM